MRTKTWFGLAILAAATMFAVSCSLDYALDFEIAAVTLGSPTAHDVTVSYRYANIGSQDMENAMIHIHVEAFDGQGMSGSDNQWTPGATLAFGEQATGDLVYSFGWPVANADAWVVGAGTDEGDSLY